VRNICLYIDEGAQFEILLREVAREIDHTRAIVRPVLAEDVLVHGCLDTADSFIMPGGADLPYCRKLNGVGNVRLKEFVNAGGTYLGICAGAYYACRSVSFHVGRADEVSGERELAFFKARAIGSLPQLGPYYDLTIASASAASIEWEGLGILRAYYNGGPRFELSDAADVTIFARYVDVESAPLGIERSVGRGKAVLVGTHLEISKSSLLEQLSGLQGGGAYRHLAILLGDSEPTRRRAFRDVLSRAGLPLNAADLES
jgi:glutamine amidotransferase-like uncharacterized protein